MGMLDRVGLKVLNTPVMFNLRGTGCIFSVKYSWFFLNWYIAKYCDRMLELAVFCHGVFEFVFCIDIRIFHPKYLESNLQLATTYLN